MPAAVCKAVKPQVQAPQAKPQVADSLKHITSAALALPALLATQPAQALVWVSADVPVSFLAKG